MKSSVTSQSQAEEIVRFSLVETNDDENHSLRLFVVFSQVECHIWLFKPFLPHLLTLEQPMCAECLSKTADFWCGDCKADYCTECCADHHKGRVAAQHRRVPINEKPPELKRCSKHGDENLKYWCSCAVPICGDCKHSKEHNGHTSALLSEVFLEVIEKVSAQNWSYQ